MGDSKSRKTITKIGKLFGVSSTNLSVLNQSQAPHSIEDDDDILSQQENDHVSPLPNEKTSPFTSPLTSKNSSFDNLHDSTTTTKTPPISRSSSTKKKLSSPPPPAAAAPVPSPAQPPSNNRNVSRSSSTKKPLSPSVSSTKLTRPVSPGTPASTLATNPSQISLASSATVNKPRFKMLDNGNHEHNLRSAKRQEKLSNMLKDLLGAKKLRDEAKSAVPKLLQNNNKEEQAKPPTLFAGLVNQVQKNDHGSYNGQILEASEQQDCRSFVEKYGRCQEVIGRGSFGVVRISHKKLDLVKGENSHGNSSEEILYAVKEFKRRQNESEKKYNRRLTSEFCISSSLKHINIIDTLDLLKDAKGDYCEVMEFCSGGDLYTLIIASGKLEYAEADCFFKQLIRGVNYMHDMGVSHRDLKPENLLLTQNGVLKITDFGNGECFKMAWENEIQLSEGICGSSPYIAPEEFNQSTFDPRCVDIWACGVIYMAMRTGRQLWQLADAKKDEFFQEYLLKRKDATGYDPIESLKRARCRNVIYSILDPLPERRINGKQILNSEWGREIRVCDAGNGYHENHEVTK